MYERFCGHNVVEDVKSCIKGVYINYMGGGVVVGEFYKFSKKYFIVQGIIELNISRPNSFFVTNFMAPQTILVNCLRLVLDSISR